MPTTLNYRRVLPIVFVVFVDLLGLTIIIPLLPLYAASFGADPLTVGLLGAMYPVAQFIGAPILGRMSDRYGRRPVLLVSQVGTLLGFVLLATAHSLALLFVSRIIDGFSGGNFSTAQAMIADETDDQSRTQGLGLVGASFGVGFVVGPLIAFASLAMSASDFHLPAWLAAGFSVVSILLTFFLLRETAPARDQASPVRWHSFDAMMSAFRHPQVGLLITLVFIQQIAFGGFQQFLALFTLSRLGMSATGNSVVFVMVGILLVIVQGGLIGRLSRRFGEIRLIQAGLVLLVCSFVLTATTPPVPVPWYSKARVSAELSDARTLPARTPPTHALEIAIPDDGRNGWGGILWLLVAMVPAAVGGGILSPSLNSLITRRVEAHERGGILGISSALLSGGNAVAPVMGGVFFQAGGPTAPFWAWGALLAVTTSVVYPRLR